MRCPTEICSSIISGISLVMIDVLIYLMRCLTEICSSIHVKEYPEPDFDVYLSPIEGFAFQDLIAAIDSFDDKFIICRGASGIVYRAILLSDQKLAAKKMGSNREGNIVDESFRTEILTLGKIRHQNIVKLHGFYFYQGSNFLLYEFMFRISLGETLHKQSSDLDWKREFLIAYGAAQGLLYLHNDCKPKIIHCDIKSNNILLNDHFETCVGDSGLAKVINMPCSKSSPP